MEMNATTPNEMLVELYDLFVESLHQGRKPYLWQTRLMREVVNNGQWMKLISAPTGSGKTAVIDVHLFVNALAGLAALDDIPLPKELNHLLKSLSLDAVPRRMAVTVNRRGIVDDQYLEASAACARINDVASLDDDTESEILKLIAVGLYARQYSELMDRQWTFDQLAFQCQEQGKVVCSAQLLRGGLDDKADMRVWRYKPLECQILCGTPDMIGSRLLFSGYGVSDAAKPIEAALLAYDAVIVVDEAQLSRQFAYTAQQIPRIEACIRQGEPLPVSPLQVVVTTATPSGENISNLQDEQSICGVEEADFKIDLELRRRLRTPRPIQVLSVDDKQIATCMAKESIALQERLGGVVVCFVNTVPRASEVVRRLREALGKDAGDNAVRAFVGPMRDYERDQFVQRLDSTEPLYDAIRGDQSAITQTGLKFVVATQTLEAGIDADFSGMISELAPAASLVQRAGRVNRRGLRPEGPVVICCQNSGKIRGPYMKEDLTAAQMWLESLPVEGLTAWSSVLQPPAPAQLERMVLQRLEWWDVENLSHTSEDVFAEHRAAGRPYPADVDLWLRDDLADRVTPDVAVVIRTLPQDDYLAQRLLATTPPDSRELFPVTSYAMLDALQNKLKGRRAFIMRTNSSENGNAVHLLDGQADSDPTLRSGDVLIVDDGARVFSEGIPMLDPFSKDDKHSKKLQDEITSPGDVFNKCQQSMAVLHANREKQPALYEELSEVLRAETDTDETVEAEYQGIDVSKYPNLQEALNSCAINNHGFRIAFVDGFIDGDSSDSSVFIVLQSSDAADGDQLQEIGRFNRQGPVLLDGPGSHQESVGSRAELFAAKLGFDSRLVGDIRTAGLHHDDGKKDPRFQTLLRYRMPNVPAEPLAKSMYRSSSWERAKRIELRLDGWRHEQRSAAECWALDSESLQAHDKELVTRLAGTSHGHGRSMFPMNAQQVIPDAIIQTVSEENGDGSQTIHAIRSAAEELFDAGYWQSIMERTNERYGLWGIAFLETLLRAADVTISMEGR